MPATDWAAELNRIAAELVELRAEVEAHHAGQISDYQDTLKAATMDTGHDPQRPDDSDQGAQ